MGISSELVFSDAEGDLAERFRAHCAAPTLVVSSLHPDTSALRTIQQSLRGEALVGGRSAFIDYCDLVAGSCAGTRRTLDVVDHASAGHVATLAGRGRYGIRFDARWLADQDARDGRGGIVARVRFLVETKAVVRIRLLGCRTGCETGVDNVRSLSMVFNVEVLGTPWPVHGNHFKKGTFCTCLDRLLVRARPDESASSTVQCQAMPTCSCSWGGY